MYSTCLYCARALGSNDAVEHFPVGRQLAYDAVTGRLWVVCRRCERWNLTPLEERWEAIEEAERLFRASRLRIASENIALARLREGLELVRIGKPPRLELANWRYGDRFGRRRRRTLALGAVSAGTSVGSFAWILGGPWATAVFVAALACNVGFWSRALLIGSSTRVPDGAGGQLDLDGPDLFQTALVRIPEVSDWSLRITLTGTLADTVEELRQPWVEFRQAWKDRVSSNPASETILAEEGVFTRERTVTLRGEDAGRALALILPRLNGTGGSARRVREAVDVVAEAASVHQLLYRAAGQHTRAAKPNYVRKLDPATRLALEIALHEDDERRAMEGELAALEQRWREAETIARIADSLAMPHGIVSRLERLKSRARGGDGGRLVN